MTNNKMKVSRKKVNVNKFYNKVCGKIKVNSISSITLLSQTAKTPFFE